jgi:hypothetical protein
MKHDTVLALYLFYVVVVVVGGGVEAFKKI